MLSPIWIVAFSGHRPSEALGRSVEALRACRTPISSALEGLVGDATKMGGTVELLTGVAAGADLEAAEAATDLGIVVHVILPKPEALFAEDFAGLLTDDWQRAKRLIEEARREDTPGTLRIAVGDNDSPACYHEANLEMLRASDALIAVWNRVPTDQLGSTAEAVRQANALGVPAVLINPMAPEDTDEVGDWSAWSESDPTLEALNAIPAEEQEADASDPHGRGGEGPAWAEFFRLDRASSRLSRQFNQRLKNSLLLHFLAAALAAINAAFSAPIHHYAEQTHDSHHWLSWFLEHAPVGLTAIEFVLVFIAWRIMWMAHNERLRQRWRTSRFAAELADGIINTSRILDPLQTAAAIHHPRWRRFAISISLLAQRATHLEDLHATREGYRSSRVEYQYKRYFDRQRQVSGKLKGRLQGVEKLTTHFAPPVIFTALLLKLFAHDWVADYFSIAFIAMFLPVIFPLTAGAALSLLVATDSGRRSERYKDMSDRLTRISSLLDLSESRGALRRVVLDSEEILLDELIEWHAAAGQTGH